MSVKKSERNESKLSVILKAERIATYTMEITGNEKNFPKRHRWSLTVKIVNTALEMLECVTRANAIHAEESQANKEKRHELQEQGYSASVWFLTLINLAYLKFHLASDRVEFWTGMVVEYQRQLRAWQKSDEVRYAEIH